MNLVTMGQPVSLSYNDSIMYVAFPDTVEVYPVKRINHGPKHTLIGLEKGIVKITDNFVYLKLYYSTRELYLARDAKEWSRLKEKLKKTTSHNYLTNSTNMGASKTSKHYAKNPESAEKHRAYQRKYNKTEKAKDYRAALNKENRKRKTYGNGDGLDVSHQPNGKTKLEPASKNRGDKNNTAGDRRARGGKKK
jgi:hypothetical protein